MSNRREAELRQARKERGCEGFVIARTSDMKIELRFPVKVEMVRFEPPQAIAAARAIIEAALETGVERPLWYPLQPQPVAAQQGESDANT